MVNSLTRRPAPSRRYTSRTPVVPASAACTVVNAYRSPVLGTVARPSSGPVGESRRTSMVPSPGADLAARTVRARERASRAVPVNAIQPPEPAPSTAVPRTFVSSTSRIPS
jgi:hypothetical protein